MSRRHGGEVALVTAFFVRSFARRGCRRPFTSTQRHDNSLSMARNGVVHIAVEVFRRSTSKTSMKLCPTPPWLSARWLRRSASRAFRNCSQEVTPRTPKSQANEKRPSRSLSNGSGEERQSDNTAITVFQLHDATVVTIMDSTNIREQNLSWSSQHQLFAHNIVARVASQFILNMLHAVHESVHRFQCLRHQFRRSFIDGFQPVNRSWFKTCAKCRSRGHFFNAFAVANAAARAARAAPSCCGGATSRKNAQIIVILQCPPNGKCIHVRQHATPPRHQDSDKPLANPLRILTRITLINCQFIGDLASHGHLTRALRTVIGHRSFVVFSFGFVSGRNDTREHDNAKSTRNIFRTRGHHVTKSLHARKTCQTTTSPQTCISMHKHGRNLHAEFERVRN